MYIATFANMHNPSCDHSWDAEGKSSFTVNGRSVAQAEAFAIASSFADALAEASICDICDVAIDFVADTFEEIYLNATAVAEVTLQGFAEGGSINATANDFIARIVSATATAFAQVRSLAPRW